MSGYKTHITFGVILSLIVYLLLISLNFVDFNIESLIIFTLIATIYSILPDIDIRTSKAYQLFLFTSIVLIFYLLLQKETLYIMIILSVMFVTLFLKHRGITHKIWFGLLISLPLVLISWVAFVIGFVAYLSHLILDL